MMLMVNEMMTAEKIHLLVVDFVDESVGMLQNFVLVIWIVS